MGSNEAVKEGSAGRASAATNLALRTSGGDDLVFDMDARRAEIEACRDVDRAKDELAKAEAAKEYLKRRKGDAGKQQDMAELVVRWSRNLGEFLEEEGPQHGGDRRSSSSLANLKLDELDITPAQSTRWRKLARLPKDRFEQHVQVIRAKVAGIVDAQAGSKSDEDGYDSDEWYTPDEYIEAAREVMGGIDLDPASCEYAQTRIHATRYFTKEQDGLKFHWEGRIWLNPPFSQPLASQFATKLREEYDARRTQQAILLQNSNTDTSWFHELAAAAHLCLPKGRIAFLQEGGAQVTGNRNAQVLFYLGGAPERFVEVFGRFGLVGKLTSGIVE